MGATIEKGYLEKHSKYFFIVCFFAAIVLSLWVIKSYIITMVSSVLLAYIFYPLYKRMVVIFHNKNIASLFTACFVVIIVTIPVIFAANALINESVSFFHKTKTLDFSKVEEKIPKSIQENVDIDGQLKEMMNRVSLAIARNTSEFLVTLPQRILHLFVLLFIMFYMFKEGGELAKKIESHIPLKESHRKDLSSKFNGVVYASLYGIVITAIVQGTVGALGLWIFGVSSPVLWGIVMIILSMLPFVGAFLVWFPAAVYKLVTGDIANGIGLMLYGLLIVSTIDNIVRPKIVGSKGKIHPVLVLLGIIGGLEVFGVLGMILGPLVLAILTVFLDLHFEKKKNIDDGIDILEKR